MKPINLLASTALVAVSLHYPSPAVSAERNEACIKKVTIMENMLAEKAQFANDRCKLLKAAAANRAAMLEEIGKDPSACGLGAAMVDSLKRQYATFVGQQSSVCR